MLLTICSIISIIYMLITTLYMFFSLMLADRETQSKRLRNYKKGKFLAHYPAAFPIFLAAYITVGTQIGLSIVNSVKSTVSTAVLSFDMDMLWPIMEFNPLFFVAAGLYIILTFVNTALFSVSLFSRRVMNSLTLRRIKKGKTCVVVLVGYTEKNRSVLASMKRGGGEYEDCEVLVITSSVTERLKEEMYINRAAYLKLDKNEDISELILNRCACFNPRRVTVIIETESDTENLKYAFQMAKLTENHHIIVNTYLFTDLNDGGIYRRITQLSGGTVHCLNKYDMIARNFITEYPLTLFRPDLIDTDKAIFKRGTDFRIIMIGFGNVNRDLFCAYTQNNQFLIENEKDGEPPVAMPLKYYIFDKCRAQEESAFNDSYMHYDAWLQKHGTAEEADKYFELPPKPADVIFNERNINDTAFSDDVKNTLTNSDRGYNVVIIALGDDISALNIAEKIATYAKEECLESKTKIFVRVRDAALGKEAELKCYGGFEIIPFGDSNSLYSYNRVTTHEADKMAMDRHLCYAIENMSDNLSEEEALQTAFDTWHFKWKNIQRDSNIYACISMRSRFHLLGYEIAKKADGTPDDSESFLADYAKDNPIVYNSKTVNGKRLVNYDTDYHKLGTPRTNIAICEHARWTAHHICNGMVPASKEEAKSTDKKLLFDRRKHINITTMDGLRQYADWKVKEYGIAERTPTLSNTTISLWTTRYGSCTARDTQLSKQNLKI